MFSESIRYGPTCLQAGASESMVCRTYRPPRFKTWAQNAQNSKKTMDHQTRTARLALDILDWRCSLTRYVMCQLVRNFGPPQARLDEDIGISSWKFGPTKKNQKKQKKTRMFDSGAGRYFGHGEHPLSLRGPVAVTCAMRPTLCGLGSGRLHRRAGFPAPDHQTTLPPVLALLLPYTNLGSCAMPVEMDPPSEHIHTSSPYCTNWPIQTETHMTYVCTVTIAAWDEFASQLRDRHLAAWNTYIRATRWVMYANGIRTERAFGIETNGAGEGWRLTRERE